jgi:hypothetical protein
MGSIYNPPVIDSSKLFFGTDSGVSDAYAINFLVPITAYVVGQPANFIANTANTGPATLNINSLGAVTIKKNYNQDLSNNDIKALQLISVIYDGTNFQLTSPISNIIISYPTYSYVLTSNFNTNSTSYINITGISHPVEANKKYMISLSGSIENLIAVYIASAQIICPTLSLLSAMLWHQTSMTPTWASSPSLRTTNTLELVNIVGIATYSYFGTFLLETAANSGTVNLQLKVDSTLGSATATTSLYMLVQQLI